MLLFRSTIYDHSGNSNSFVFRYYLHYFEPVNDIEFEKTLPTEFSLSSAYPNPFNPTTTIEYTLPKESHVLLSIYDSRGIIVDEIVNDQKSTGYHQVIWDASAMPSGIYFYKIRASEFVDVKKCLLVK